ncbi:hypothetical protein D3C72_2372460 [compost metagenome]
MAFRLVRELAFQLQPRLPLIWRVRSSLPNSTPGSKPLSMPLAVCAVRSTAVKPATTVLFGVARAMVRLSCFCRK